MEFLGTINADKWASTTKKGTACIKEHSCYLPTLYAKELPQYLYLQKHSSLLNTLIFTSTGCGSCTGVALLGTIHNWSFFAHLSGCRVGACQGRLMFGWETFGSFLHGDKNAHWQTQGFVVTLCCIMGLSLLGLLKSLAQSRLQFLLEAAS